MKFIKIWHPETKTWMLLPVDKIACIANNPKKPKLSAISFLDSEDVLFTDTPFSTIEWLLRVNN